MIEPTVKRPGDDDTVTEEQAEELMKCKRDIDYFASTYVYVDNSDYGEMLFSPRNYQQEMLSAYSDNRFIINVAPRQCGKTQSTVVFLLHQTIFFPYVKVGCAAQKQDQAKEILDRYKFSYERLPMWMKPAVKSYNELRVNLTNGSHVEVAATTANTFRGRSKTILYLDEFSHVPENVIQGFWTSLLPVISGGGKTGKTKIFISSTPNGTEGLFAKIYHDAVNNENSFFPLLTDHKQIPGRDEEWRKAMIEDMGSLEKYLQEFECAWISTKGTLIHPMKLEELKPTNPKKEIKDLRMFDDVKFKKLGLAVDVGTGIGKDYSAIQIFDIDTLDQVGEYRNNTLNTLDFTYEFIKIMQKFIDEGAKEIYYGIENNSIGNTVLSLIQASDDPLFEDARINQVDQNHKTKGLSTNTKTKMAGCMVFKNLVETDKLKIKSKYLITELKFFVKQGQTFKAESGMNDDLVMSCVILANMLKVVSNWEPNVYDNLNGVRISLGEDDDEPMPIVLDTDIDDFDDDDFGSIVI